jgi:hypothetical protein
MGGFLVFNVATLACRQIETSNGEFYRPVSRTVLGVHCQLLKTRSDELARLAHPALKIARYANDSSSGDARAADELS